MNELARSLMTISCRDTDAIPKVPNAGSTAVIDGQQVQLMHKGLRVAYGGYCGEWMAHIIRGLSGHHEPQEELVFHTLLRYARDKSIFVELGAYWAYYTLWFLTAIPGARALCVEPDMANLEVGRRNATLNHLLDRIEFCNAWVGGARSATHAAVTETTKQFCPLPMLNFPAIVDQLSVGCIEVIHLDIQGAELPFLQSIDRASVLDGRVRFLVLSTHHSSISGSPTTHSECLDTLRALGGTILVEHDIGESYSGDGLIVASMCAEDTTLWFPAISRNRAATSLFGHL